MIEERIMEELEGIDEDISIVIKDLTRDEWVLKYNEEEIYPSASLIKIPIMIEALYQVEEDLYSLEEKIRIRPEDRIDHSLITDLSIEEYPFVDLIRLMIILSDNTATNILVDLLGMEKINRRIVELGCKETILQRKMLDFEAAKEGRENFTNPLDMEVIMGRIYEKSIVNPEKCDLMIDILSKQRHRDKLPRYITDQVRIAHKTGELSGLNHDVGIFYLKNRDYYIGIFTNKAKDDIVGKMTIGRISKIAYDTLSL